ncbi:MULTISPECIES: hypothetical protein [Vibrio harveyi group]|nr:MULTISPECIES: hypothetical protein [Vibrio harveyi group]
MGEQRKVQTLLGATHPKHLNTLQLDSTEFGKCMTILVTESWL